MTAPDERARLDAELLAWREGGGAELSVERALLLGQACLEADADLHADGRSLLLGAAAAGSSAGAWLAAYALMEGLGGGKDLDGGLTLLAQAAQGGIAEAAFELGQLLARAGETAAALPWLGRAADQEHPDALRMLGRLAAGVGDSETAEALLTAASEAGCGQALYDRFLLLAEFGPSDRLISLLDAVLARREVPAALLAQIGRLVAGRDPEAMLSLAVPVTAQGRAGRQAFLDGMRRGAPDLFNELGADLIAVLELG